MQQELIYIGRRPIYLTADNGDEALYYLAGKRLYEIGAVSGEYPPLGWRRPGFLVGKRISDVGPEDRPITSAHLLREMGGVWAHPVKAIERIRYDVEENGQRWTLTDAERFVHRLASAEFHYSRNGLRLRRRDFVVEDEPALFSLLLIENETDHARSLVLHLCAEVNLIPSWFSGWPNGRDELLYREGRVLAYDHLWPAKWGCAFGADRPPDQHAFGDEDGRPFAVLSYRLDLAPGHRVELPFLFAADHEQGYEGAERLFRSLLGRQDQLLEAKAAAYAEQIDGPPRFDCSDSWLTDAYALAKANLVMLLTDLSPYLGRYLFAGLPEYVQFFGCDTTYSVPGITAAWQPAVARDCLEGLAAVARRQCGRVPHELTTNGRVFHPGNTQETPQFAIACWKHYLWTGDRAFLEAIYPLCAEGVLDYVLAQWDVDLDYYPDGNAMVERLGMGPEKLDSVCYFCQAISCLADMAEALGRDQEARRHRELAETLREAINVDFWDEEVGLYADSLTDDHRRQQDGHWTQVVPLETGVADPARADRVLANIERDWLNPWGMVHTRGGEELVWTLPTGLLALTELQHGNVGLGVRLLGNIAETVRHGMLGAFKELIPEGMCFIQLWSPAIYLQGIVEGLFGVEPRADRHAVELFPKLPADWTHMELADLRIGEHELDVRVERQAEEERMTLRHRAPTSPLHCRLSLFGDGLGEPPVEPVITGAGQMARQITGTLAGRTVIRLELDLEPGQEVQVVRSASRVVLESVG